MRIDRWCVWLLDEALDRIPRVERFEGHWYWYRRGLWGCQLQLWKYWDSK